MQSPFDRKATRSVGPGASNPEAFVSQSTNSVVCSTTVMTRRYSFGSVFDSVTVVRLVQRKG